MANIAIGGQIYIQIFLEITSRGIANKWLTLPPSAKMVIMDRCHRTAHSKAYIIVIEMFYSTIINRLRS